MAVVVSVTFVCAAHARMSVDERVADAQTLISLIAHRYAPLTWKEEHLGISFEALSEELLVAAESQGSDEDFYAAMIGFIAGFSDVHMSMTIPSSQSKWLGFETDSFDGEVVISGISRRELSRSDFPFDVGDRLVSIDGIAAEEIRDAMAQYRRFGNASTEERLFASWIVSRRQAQIPHMPEHDTAWVVIQSRKSGSQRKVAMPWIEQGRALAPVQTDAGLSRAVAGEILSPEGEVMENPLDRMRRLTIDGDLMGAMIGDFRPFFPLWEGFEVRSSQPFFSGIATIGGRKIGFLRIHTWMPMNPMANVEFLAKTIPAFEAETDALIIDQTGNGGGNLCYLEAVTAFFAREPIEKMLFRIRANRNWLVIFESYLPHVEPGSEDERLVNDIVSGIRRAMMTGKPLTDPFPLCSGGLTVDAARDEKGETYLYTKPILLLINELDASAADVFPAVMQDAGRAVLMGSRTMGAGGNVVGVGPFGHSDISVRLTESLMWRSKAVSDGQGGKTNYIENIGVTPDIPYDFGLEDYLEHYSTFRDTVDAAVLDLIDRDS